MTDMLDLRARVKKMGVASEHLAATARMRVVGSALSGFPGSGP
jgi:hypothetical protein